MYKTLNKNLKMSKLTNCSVLKPKFLKSGFYKSSTFKKNYFDILYHRKRNNIFCVMRNKNRTLYFQTTGSVGLKVSKKNLNQQYYNFFKKFLNRGKHKFKKIRLKIRLTIISPRHQRKKLFKLFYYFSKNARLQSKKVGVSVIIPRKKTYNGCIGKKIVRKKQRKLKYLISKI